MENILTYFLAFCPDNYLHWCVCKGSEHAQSSFLHAAANVLLATSSLSGEVCLVVVIVVVCKLSQSPG